MIPEEPESFHAPFDQPENASLGGSDEVHPYLKIELDEKPRPQPPEYVAPGAFPETDFTAVLPESEPQDLRPSRMDPIKAMVKATYFDPAKAFAREVNWARFRRVQIALFFLSLAMPFVVLLLLGVMLGVVYLTGASLYGATSPNPTYLVMLYPLVFVLARGYWMAYLALPLGLFAMGWLWAAATAWAISCIEDGAHIDFKKALSVLAMFAAMLAPFTLFPFLRLVALVVILWFVVRRLEDTFDIAFWPLVGRGLPILMAAAFVYGSFERKVESYFPAGEELKANLNAFVQKKKMLEWPSFRAEIYIDPKERLYADLSNLSSQIREPAVQKALALLKAGIETPEYRYRMALRLAENGQTEAYPFLSNYTANGQGTPVDMAAALIWMQKFTELNPDDLGASLTLAQLLIRNDRKLQGKRYLVHLAKAQLAAMPQITGFIQKERLGHIEPSLTTEVLSLYQGGNTVSYVGSYRSDSGSSRYGYETQTRQETLLKRLYGNEHDTSLWFYRAMAWEYNRSESAGPETYGEPPATFDQADLDQKILNGDPVAMDITADRLVQEGEIAKAREQWVNATRVLNSDNRCSNVPYYMKLAESYDPNESNKSVNAHEATKYYLAALLISCWQSRGEPVGKTPLQRLQPGKIPEPSSQSFLDLCLKYDIPEAWAMMGDRYINGDFPGVATNRNKGRECFLKAQSLGYKGPEFGKQLAKMSVPEPLRK